MSYETFKGIMGRLGIPENKCKHDKEKGLFIAYRDGNRFTSNHYSNSVTVRVLHSGVTYVAKVGAMQA